MKTNHMVKLGLLAGMTAGLCLGTAAQAQDETKPREVRGELLKPLKGSAPRAAQDTQNHSTLVMSRNENGDEVTVRVENGEMTATRNGKAVPADKIRKSDNKIEILGDNGEVVSTFNIGFAGGMPGEGKKPWRTSNGGRIVQGQPLATISTTKPKVMIGINMSTADGKLAEHLGLKEGGVVLDSVIEGLPASKAGLKANDVVVEIEGKKVSDENDIRQTLKSKNPGDTIKVKYIRQGAAAQEATITLEGFDAEKLGSDVTGVFVPGVEVEGHNPFGQALGQAWGQGGAESPWVVNLGGMGHVEIDHEKLRDAIESAMKEMEDKHKQMDEVRVEVRKHLDEALKELARSRKQFEEHSKELGDRVRIDSLPRLSSLFGRKDSVMVAPRAPEVPEVAEIEIQKNEKFDRILENLERLNKRLDDLEKKVESKK